MDKPMSSPVVFDLPWSLIKLEADPAVPNIFRSGALRDDVQKWLDQNMASRYRIEDGVFATKANVINRHFRIHFDLERDAVFFRLRWGEETRLPRTGESFTVHIMVPGQ